MCLASKTRARGLSYITVYHTNSVLHTDCFIFLEEIQCNSIVQKKVSHSMLLSAQKNSAEILKTAGYKYHETDQFPYA